MSPSPLEQLSSPQGATWEDVRRVPAHLLDSLDGLSGRLLYVLRGSSYEQHLRDLNERFKAQGRVPAEVTE